MALPPVVTNLTQAVKLPDVAVLGRTVIALSPPPLTELGIPESVNWPTVRLPVPVQVVKGPDEEVFVYITEVTVRF